MGWNPFYKKKDVYSGTVISFFIMEKDYYHKTVVKNVIQYVHDGWSAKEYILNYANYGDNPYRKLNQAIKRLNNTEGKFEKSCYKKAVRICKYGITNEKEADKRKEAQEGYDWLLKNEARFKDISIIPSIGFAINKTNTVNFGQIIYEDTGIAGASIMSIIIEEPDDDTWCKAYLQDHNGYNVDTDTLRIEDEDYGYYKTIRNGTNYTVTMKGKVSFKTKDFTIPAFRDGVEYLICRYAVNRQLRIYIKETYITTSSRGTDIVWIKGNKKSYQYNTETGIETIYDNSCFPTLIFRSNDTNLEKAKFKPINNELLNPFMYQVMDELYKCINMSVKDMCELFDKVNSSGTSLQTGFYALGIPLTAKREDDTDDFEEPEILSKTLYETFEPLINNSLLTGTNVLEPHPRGGQTISMNWTQSNNYNARLEFQCNPIQVFNGKIHNRRKGHFWHSVKSAIYYKIYDISFKYTGVVYDEPLKDGGIKKIPQVAVVATEYVLKDSGTKWESSIVLDGTRLPADGFKAFQKVISKPISEYIDPDDIYVQRTVFQSVCKDTELFGNIGYGTHKESRWIPGGEDEDDRYEEIEVRNDYLSSLGLTGKSLSGAYEYVRVKKTDPKTGKEYWEYDYSQLAYLDTNRAVRYAITPNYIGWFREDLDQPYKEQPKYGGGSSDGAFMEWGGAVASNSAKRYNSPLYNDFASCYGNFNIGLGQKAKQYAPKNVRQRVEAEWKENRDHGFSNLNDWYIPASRFTIPGVTLCKQITSNQYNQMVMFYVKYITAVHGSKADIMVMQADPLGTDNDIIIPLNLDVVLKSSILDKVALMAVSHRVVAYYYHHERVKVPRGWIAEALKILQVAIVVFTVATGGLGSFVDILIQLAIQLGVALLLKLIIKTVKIPWLAAVLSIGVIAAGAWAGAGFKMPAINFMNVTTLVTQVTNAIVGIWSRPLGTEYEELQREQEAFEVKAESATKELKEYNKQHGKNLLTTGDLVMLTYDDAKYINGEAIFDLSQSLYLPLDGYNGELARSLAIGVTYEAELEGELA